MVRTSIRIRYTLLCAAILVIASAAQSQPLSTFRGADYIRLDFKSSYPLLYWKLDTAGLQVNYLNLKLDSLVEWILSVPLDTNKYVSKNRHDVAYGTKTWDGTATFNTVAGTGTRVALVNSSGVLQALANATNGQVLTLSAGTPAWMNSASSSGRTYIHEGTVAPTVVKIDSNGAEYTVDLQAGADGTIPKSNAGFVQWENDENHVQQTFWFSSMNVGSTADTANNVGSISVFAGWNHWMLDHKAHAHASISYTIGTNGERIGVTLPATDVPANSSVILRFWPGPNPTFKVYAVPLSTGRTNPKTGYYGQLLGSYATNISLSGSQSILAIVRLRVK